MRTSEDSLHYDCRCNDCNIRQTLLYSGLILLIGALIAFVIWTRSNASAATPACLFVLGILCMRLARVRDKRMAARARP